MFVGSICGMLYRAAAASLVNGLRQCREAENILETIISNPHNFTPVEFASAVDANRDKAGEQGARSVLLFNFFLPCILEV